MKRKYLLCIVLALAVFLAGCKSGEKEKPEKPEAQVSISDGSPDGEKAGAETPAPEGLTEETIVLPGLTKEYTFLFLTDMHLSVQSDDDSKEVEEYAAPRRELFQSAEGTPAAEQFGAWIRIANERKVDAVLLGGDIIDYPSEANIGYLKEELVKLQVPYLYTPGNHDWTYPWEYMTAEGKELYLPLLAPFMQENPAIHSLKWEDLTVTAVDDCSNQINPEAMEEYRNLLQEGKNVILLLHVPLFTESALVEKGKGSWSSPVVLGGGVHGGIYPNETSTEFIRLTEAQDSPVAAVLAGHVHFQDRGLLNGNTVQIIGAAGFQGSAVLLHVTGDTK